MGAGANKLWPPSGLFTSYNLTPAQAASKLQSAGYASEGLALAVAYNLPQRLIVSLAQAAGAQQERTTMTEPVTGFFKLPGLPGLDFLKYLPWIAAAGVGLYLLPYFVKRK